MDDAKSFGIKTMCSCVTRSVLKTSESFIIMYSFIFALIAWPTDQNNDQGDIFH